MSSSPTRSRHRPGPSKRLFLGLERVWEVVVADDAHAVDVAQPREVSLLLASHPRLALVEEEGEVAVREELVLWGHGVEGALAAAPRLPLRCRLLGLVVVVELAIVVAALLIASG